MTPYIPVSHAIIEIHNHRGSTLMTLWQQQHSKSNLENTLNLAQYVHLSLLSPTPANVWTPRSFLLYGRSLEGNVQSQIRRGSPKADMDNSYIALSDAWWWSGWRDFIVGACKHYLPLTPHQRYIILTITRPIGTYSERGYQKPSIDLATHAVIHEAGKPPQIDDEARKSMKEPIAVTLEDSAQLYPNSRIDFGMIHSVHRNVRVKPLGELTENSKRLVGQYAREVFSRGIPDGY